MADDADNVTIETAVSPTLTRLRNVVLFMVRAGEETNLSLRQLGVLLLLNQAGGPRTVRGLAAALKISKPAITRTADILAELGLAERREDPDDGRSVLIIVTHQGRLLSQRLGRAMHKSPSEKE